MSRRPGPTIIDALAELWPEAAAIIDEALRG